MNIHRTCLPDHKEPSFVLDWTICARYKSLEAVLTDAISWHEKLCSVFMRLLCEQRRWRKGWLLNNGIEMAAIGTMILLPEIEASIQLGRHVLSVNHR